jgi:hypothetical protein
MAQIFLSYAREDRKRVEKLYQELSKAGFKPWMDKRDILPGEKWELAIQKAIQRSDFFLICRRSCIASCNRWKVYDCTQDYLALPGVVKCGFVPSGTKTMHLD